MAEIRLSAINKVYPDGTHAVHDVDLHIHDGEFMIMVGPSGCAKSTILRMIAGLEVPTSGTIEIGGRVVNDVAPKDRDIAMVFQSYALYPHMTVAENMAFGLKLRKMPPNEIEQRIQDAARILGLENLLHRLPKQMSGGQRQRVAMGRAIVREPQCFLMDEPLSNLDAKLRVQMRTEIAKLHQRLRTTTVYVTHDQVEAMTLGQRICILRKGIVQQVDTPFMVYTNPSNIFVGGFIGSPGMNFMLGTLHIADGTVLLKLGEYVVQLPQAIVERLTVGDIDGRPVHVGIRPEHICEAGGPVQGRAMLPASIELVEAMGSEAYAYYTWPVEQPNLSELADAQGSGGTETFVAKISASTTAQTGDQIWMEMDLNELHLFDPHSMQTLLAPRLVDTIVEHGSYGATSGAVAIHHVIPTDNVIIPAAHAPQPVTYATPQPAVAAEATPITTAWAEIPTNQSSPIAFPGDQTAEIAPGAPGGPFVRPALASTDTPIPRPTFASPRIDEGKSLLPPPSANFGRPETSTSKSRPSFNQEIAGTAGDAIAVNLFQNRPRLNFDLFGNSTSDSDA